jgi:putative copper export protein/mono/diheme cytochrome c family protein
VLPIDPEGGWLLTLTRSLSVAACLSAFGALIFRGVVLPKIAARVAPDIADARIVRLVAISLASSLPLLLAWAVFETKALADTGSSLRSIASALPTVIGATAFGHVWLAQLAATLISLAVLHWKPGAALLPCTAALILQAGHSHALSMYGGPSILLLSDVVHLLAAGGWLGGLLPLLLTVRNLPLLGGALAARWFSPLGKLCVIALTVTAAYQGWVLIDSIPGLIGSAYGEMGIGKLALFGALFAFAVLNRYRFAPALSQGDPATAKRTLVRSIAVQTGFGLAIVVAAGVLSNLPPSLHEQPIWPFAVQPSLMTVNEDPEFKRMVVVALLMLGGAGLLLALALARRRFRLAAIAISAGVTWIAAPSLRLLVVPAYPTSFYRSPTDFAATSIMHGASLYSRDCAICHGATGQGDGAAAASLAIPPANLTQAHLWAHSDGEMFWWLTSGIEAPNGGMAMPGFAAKLSADDRWTLIDFVRANNAGTFKRSGEAWPVPIASPDLVANCDSGRSMALTTLRGHAVRLVFAGGPPPTPLDDPDLITITVGRAASGCVATDPAVAEAYAIVLGTSAASLAGSEILIDPNGWIRSESLGTTTPAILAALVREICTNPLAAVTGGHHHEH